MPTLDRAVLSLYIYDGTSGSQSSSNLRYTLAKQRIAGQSNILFEISDLVRDYIDHEFNNDYTSSAKWVAASTQLFDPDGIEFASGSPVVRYSYRKILRVSFRYSPRE